ncbi:type II toxin-antitoxin system Phd/YefM family antitoxin [Streptomyces sp. NPDC020742]|uniref:type II toxin-antitoxin system Phd/YefM family antitoxin n=1 Tax=unclassified Streptomyces TaxID=2593676 RepID=UPI0033DED4AD
MAYEIPVTQARAELAELINRVVYGGERVVVTRHGKPLVALVSAAELEQLDSVAQEASERVIGTVSFVSEVPPSSSDQSQFGLIARYDSPYGP